MLSANSLRKRAMPTADVVGGSASDVDKTAVVAVPARKAPPPETTASIRTRRWAIASFWIVALLLGLPIWWISTTVYRATLPLEQMSHWAEGRICSPVYPLEVTIEAPSLQSIDALHLLHNTQYTLERLNIFPTHHLRLSLPESPESDSSNAPGNTKTLVSDRQDGQEALVIRLSQEKRATEPKAILRPHTKILDITYSAGMLPSSQSSPSVLSDFIATKLRQFFAEEQALLATLRGSSLPAALANHLAPEVAASLSKRTTRSVKYAPTFHLTFSLFTPIGSPSGWDIEKGLEEIFAPLLKTLSHISNFTIDTQVQPYSSLPTSIQPVYDESRKSWTLSERDLGGFINAAEWPLSPSIGAAPTINFLLYAASPSMSPLVIHQSGSNGWLVPQWGAVSIYNCAGKLGSPPPNHLTVEAIRPALLAFSSQLLLLLGVPSTPPESLPLRLSTLTRVRAAELFFSASSTLGSLARLVLTLPSISIPDSVADNVAVTLQQLDAACSNFQAGNFDRALQNGKAAESHAEKAFFEKSMVGQVYFPDEHKVAVYLPLLGPVAVPLVVAAVKEIRAVLLKRRLLRQN